MCCFVILLLSNEMQMSVRRFSAIPHLRAVRAPQRQHLHLERLLNGQPKLPRPGQQELEP